LYADIDREAIARSHARELFLRHRRPELYADWVGRRWNADRTDADKTDKTQMNADKAGRR
jgi:hypothetical protein